MFSKLFDKIRTLADHHQAFIAIVIAVCVITFTWGVERLLEHYIFPKKSLRGYIIAIVVGLFILWLTRHFVLHVI